MARPSADDIHVPEGSPDRAEHLVELLKSYRIGVYLTILSVTALLVSGRWQIPSIPPWAALYLKIFAIGILPSIILGKKLVVEPHMPDNRLLVHVWDVPDDEIEAARSEDRTIGRLEYDSKWVPPGLWKDRERGERTAWSPPGNVDYVVTEFDYDSDAHKLKVDGLNEEISNPPDLAVRDGRLGEIYGDLLPAKSQLNRLEATVETKVLSIESQNVNALLEAVEHGAPMSGTDALSTVRGEDWGERQESADEKEDPERTEPERPTFSDVMDAAESVSDPAVATDGGERE